MSRYQWPARVRPKDDAIRRMRHNVGTTGALGAGVVSAREAAQAPVPGPTIAPTGDANLWVPIGPSAVMRGQAGSRPRVAGRVRDVAVSPDGQRAYAASANGGVWFSRDAGDTWSPLGNWFPTPTTAPITRPAQTLACGCLLVTFGGAPDGSADDVYVGTGELVPELDRGFPGGKLGGVGVLHLTSTVPVALANPFGSHWKREAKNLTGAGIYRLARDPGDGPPNTIVAATSIGLFARTGPFVEDADWVQVTKDPFNFSATSGKVTTDVAWAKAGPQRLWVALVAGSDTKVYASANGINGPFDPVNLLNAVPGGRLGIALAPADETVVYVLGAGPRLWRIAGVAPTQVQNLPNNLFMSASDQSAYDLCIAVHPDNANLVIAGGAATKADGEWSAALFRFSINLVVGGGFTAGFAAANQANPANDNTYIGNGVHSDVHQIVYRKIGAAFHVWVGCDGGVFRSTAAGDRYSFLPRNSGLAILEAGYVASHPLSGSFVIAGAQDNGAVLRVGDTVWSFTDVVGGDGGCVLIHPVKHQYFVGQYVGTSWSSNGTLSPPVERHARLTKSEGNEAKRSYPYSTADIRKVGAGPQVRLALGTNRVWLADNWDPQAIAPTAWVTLPSNRDPRRAGEDDDQDTFGDKTGSVVAVRWVDDDRLLVLMRSYQLDGSDSVVRLLIRKPDGSWDPHNLSEHHNKCSDFGNSDISATVTSDYLPPLGAWSDIAVHVAGPGTNVSCYVACTGHVEPNGAEADRMDTLWWYDGQGKWYSTGLRVPSHAAPGSVVTKAPAYAVVVDPGDTSIVYVGTAAGVWRGALTFDQGNNPPTPVWTLRPFSNGLPEAPVQDLSFFHPGPDGLHPGPKLLRAAIQARGIWEVDLGSPAGPTRRTFLRVHPTDARRAETTSLVNPMRVGPANWPWHASPDIRIRPAPLAGAEVAPPFPPGPATWAGAAPPGMRFQLWVFQTALHKVDPLCRPTGNWTDQFASRLRALPGGGNTVNAARWQSVVINAPANVYADPWDGREPMEADLFELVVEQGQDSDPIVGPPEISLVQPRRYRVDVLVHYRDLRAVGASQVKVILLRRNLPQDGALWPAIAISADWKAKVVQMLGGAPVALPDTWTNADVVFTNLSPQSDIDARLPRAATFTVDFGAVAPNPPFQRIMLLAVVHSIPDPVSAATLAGDTLQDLILKSHQVAARVVEVRP